MSDELVTDTCAVGERDGNVILEFPKPVRWAAFDTETAKNIGMAMAKQAYETFTGQKGADGGKIITDELRAKLVMRIGHIVRDGMSKGLSGDQIAPHVVDTILSEVS